MDSELRFRRLFETAQDGILVLHADTAEITDLNPFLIDLLGYQKDELLGQKLHNLSLFQTPDGGASLLEEVRAANVARRDDLSVLTRDGKPINVEVSAALYRERDQQVIQCHIRDIRPRKSAEQFEERMRQAQKMEAVGQLAGGVAHDFNNLLGVILGYCDALEDSEIPLPALKMVREIRKAGDSAKNLTQRLLIFSRQQPTQLRHMNLNHLITGMERMLGRSLGENIELISRLAPTLGTIHADPAQIEQVLLNLCVNARDAMPQGGRIFVETEDILVDQALADQYPSLAPGPHVMLTVRDTGTGMEPEVQAHIFEPFFSTKEPGHGTGLGLSTVFAIVRKAGGAIGVYSELGKGTTFRIFIPHAQQDPAQHSPTHPEPHLTSQLAQDRLNGGETVLLVDDSPPLRRLTKRILEGAGYTVLDHDDPAQALEMFQQHQGHIPLVITDVVMPGINGFVLGSRIQALRPGTRILYISGYNDQFVAKWGTEQQRYSFLEKPFSRAALLKKVRDLLDAPPAPAPEKP